MKKLLHSKRGIAAIALTGAIVLGAGGVAAALFTGSNSATGQGSVGNGAIWNVSLSVPTGAPLLPGVGTQTLTYTIKNTTNTAQTLHSVTAELGSSGGNITQGGAPAPGCLSIWFNLVPKTPALPQSVAPHSTVTDTVALSMPASSVDQDACQGTTPDISVSAS